MTKYFEDFQPGDVHESRGRTITESDIMNFAGLTGDFTELHTNAEFAASGPFGQRIAHGLLVLSMSTGLIIQMNLMTDSLIAFYGIEKLRFTKPVFIGDTIHVVKKVAETLERGAGRGVVTFSTTVLNQRNEPVLVYSDKLVVKRRS
ncbi:MAG TPA: MaoC/PaaZ C-terminal domain-containing protein [Bryobacteraceae bacterium]|nr:MaoC/PaaZ C-terminal domain-containing protein [Bryobacteraceae bacterium]